MKERTCCFLKLILEFAFLHLLRDCSQLFWVLVSLVCWDHGSSIVDFFRNVEDDDDDRQSDYLFPALSQMEGEDYEATDPSVDWINKIIAKIWKSCLSEFVTKEHVSEMIEDIARDCEEEHPSHAKLLRRIEVEELTLGEPIKVTHLSIVSQTPDYLGIRLDLVYPGDATFALKLKKPEIEASAEILSLQFSFLIVLGPFHNDSSLVGGAEISFLDEPKIVLEGGGILWLPVKIVMLLFRYLGLPLLDYLVIHPNHIKINLPESLIGFAPLERQDADGILRVMLVEGKNLKSQERSCLHQLTFGLVGTSRAVDLFAYLRLGRDWAKTHTVSRSLTPRWDFYTEFPMTEPRPTELKIELWDKNRVAENEDLGRTSVDIGGLEDGELVDTWLDINSGEVRCLLQFVPCSPEIVSKQGVLVILIRRLFTNKSIVPMMMLQISGQSYCTTVKGRLGDYFEFQEQLALLVKDMDEDLLRITLGDFNQLTTHSVFLKHRKPEFSEELGFFMEKELVYKDQDVNNFDFEPIGELILPVSVFEDKEDFSQDFDAKTSIGSRVEFSAKLFTIPTKYEEDNQLLSYFEEIIEKSE